MNLIVGSGKTNENGVNFYMNLKIGSKLMVSFLLIASLVGFVSIVSYHQLSKVKEPLTKDIPEGLAELETTSRLDSLAQRIRYFDQVLTDAARNYALTGDRKWKHRYKNIEPQLDEIIKEAIQKGDDDDKKSFSTAQKAKLAFSSLEYQSIAAVDNGEKALALSSLESEEYWQLKDDYKRALEDYVERRGRKYNETLEVTATQVNKIVQQTYQFLTKSINRLIQVAIVSVLLGIGLGIMVSRSIVKPVQMLQQGTEIIGKGNLDHQIPVETNDELGQLAIAFNKMAQKLAESYTVLESKVKERTTELAQKVEEDEAILASIGEGMIATDQNGKIIKMNQQAKTLFGWQEEEMIGRPANSVLIMENDKGKAIADSKNPILTALKTAQEISLQINFVRKDKSKFPAVVTVSPILMDKKVIGTIAISRDITKEKEIDRMKTEFVSTVSHELRTPLTIIKEFVSLVLDEVAGSVNDKQKNYLVTAKDNIDRLARIINDLLDISKIEAGKVFLNRSFVDFKSLLNEILDHYKTYFEKKGITVQTSCDQTIPQMYLDRDKVIQILTNLIGNASKFTQPGGLVVVTALNRDKELEVSVADTGSGISTENLKKVFGKFEQFGRTAGSGAKGTGLGLAISRGLVELHGGKIWVESELEKGTKFTFTLPYQSVDTIFALELRQKFKEAQRKNVPISMIKVSQNHGQNGTAVPVHSLSDFELHRLKERIREYLPKSHDVVLQCDEGKALAVLMEANSQAAEAVQKKICDEINRLNISDYVVKTIPISLESSDENLHLLLTRN